MESIKEKLKTINPELKKELGVENTLAVPRLVKVVISSGTGSQKDKHRKELVFDRLSRISGQKPSLRLAKKAISNFKTRLGDQIGVSVTLRGERMYSFLDKLVHIAIPRMRDFRGLSLKGVDEMGNFTIGIKEHTIFPETAEEDLKDVFGLAITIVTTAKNKKEATALFRAIGLPFVR
jgi:large subunit ribosomal protein L5